MTEDSDTGTSAENGDRGLTADDLSEIGLEERHLQAKLDAGSITDAEYARLTALRFGRDPDEFSFGDAADFYDLTEDELRAEMDWLAGETAKR